MPRSLLVLVGPREEAELVRLGARLRARDVPCAVWDTTDWTAPAAPRLSLGGPGAPLRLGETALDEVRAVWVRNLGLEPTAARLEEQLTDRPFSLLNQLREVRGALASALHLLEGAGVPVINPSRSVGIHGLKLLQLHRFRAAGLRVPATLVTNDPAALRAFAARHPRLIFKPVAGGGYARALAAEDLSDERLAALRNVPVQFQERIEGASLRCYVLAGRVVAAGRIVSEALDYRTEPHTVEALEPDPALARIAVSAAEAVGLVFSGVDLLLGEGEPCVLEANPSPMFAVFDQLAGTDVCGALAEYLAELGTS